MGVDRESVARQHVEPAKLRELGVTAGGLSVMMLDAGRTLREMVAKLAPDLESAQRITEHPLFNYLANYLAGANEYMAMEKLLSVLEEEQFDLLILDTPPSRHALDFLDAPGRLTDAIDGPITKAFAKAVRQGSRLSLDWVAKGAALVLKSIGKLTGAEFLQQLATLIAELNSVFGGFTERARTVAKAFRDPSFGYVLVTRPVAAALEDARSFGSALEEREVAIDAVVVNHLHVAPADWTAATQATLAVAAGPALAGKIEDAVRLVRRRAQRELQELSVLNDVPSLSRVRQIRLPAVAGGVSNLHQLTLLAELMAPEA